MFIKSVSFHSPVACQCESIEDFILPKSYINGQKNISLEQLTLQWTHNNGGFWFHCWNNLDCVWLSKAMSNLVQNIHQYIKYQTNLCQTQQSWFPIRVCFQYPPSYTPVLYPLRYFLMPKSNIWCYGVCTQAKQKLSWEGQIPPPSRGPRVPIGQVLDIQDQVLAQNGAHFWPCCPTQTKMKEIILLMYYYQVSHLI